MSLKDIQWTKYLNTFVPLIALIGSFVLWNLNQASTLAVHTATISQFTTRLYKIENQLANVPSIKRIDSLQNQIKENLNRTLILPSTISQVKKNTRDIEHILKKLDQQRDILIEVRTLVKYLVDQDIRIKKSLPTKE